MAEDESEGDVLDFTGCGLDTIELPAHACPIGLIYDQNNITKIENVGHCRELQQLSLASNKIHQIVGLKPLLDLSILNLANNNIVRIEGLANLIELTWLDLSGNKIETIENMSRNVNLRHLDLSDNQITAFGDLSDLIKLKTLLLHENQISTLAPVPTFLSPSLNVLSLESNNISDLYEVSHLSSLTRLEQLSLANNPCVDMTAGTQGFDYRPFVLSWCFALQLLDGYVIVEKERLHAKWLFDRGQCHYYTVGEHDKLVEYLATVCPLTFTDQLKTQEDVKLSRILAKQQYNHRRLPQESHVAQSINTSRSDDVSTQQQVESSSPLSTPDSHSRSDWAPVNAWSSSTVVDVNSHEPGTSRRALTADDLTLQDVSVDDFDGRSSISLLESESVYLPVQPAQRPSTASGLTSDSTPSRPLDSTRPSTASELAHETKYEAYDRRMIRPLNQEILKGTAKPTFEYSPPQTSGTGPVKRTRKQTPPTAQGQDYDTSVDNSVCGGESSAESNADKVPPRAVSLIRDIAGARKAQKTIEERKAQLFHKMDKKKSEAVSRNNSNSKSSIPVLTSTANKAEVVSERLSEKVSEKVSERLSEKVSERLSEKVSERVSEKVSERASKHKNSDAKSTKSRINSEKVEEMGRLGGLCNNTVSSVRDSGFLSRPCSDAVLADTTLDEHRAAMIIQSFWRGYFARYHNPEVVSVRKEIRARRAQDHIEMLKAELEQQRQLYVEEKKLRTLQMEAIKTLWQEVQSLQNWKNEVLASQSFQLSQDCNKLSLSASQDCNKLSVSASQDCNKLSLSASQDCNKLSLSASQRLQHGSQHSSSDTNDKLSDGTLRSAFSPVDLDKHRDLEKTCASLQEQVSQLQKAFESLPNNVFNTSSINVNTNADVTDSLRITCNIDEDFDQSSHLGSLHSGRWSIVPHSLSPYPSEEEENYFCQIRQFGVATPPRSLTLQHKGENSVILRWMSSKLVDEHGKDAQSSIIGYRVYINDQCKALVPNNQLSVAAVGLDSQTTYKFYVKALSPLGESFESNIIMAKLAKVGPNPPMRPAPSSDSDSDKDHDSTETVDRKQQHRKRENRKTRRVKSPRSEKQKTRSRSENTATPSVTPSTQHCTAAPENYGPSSQHYRQASEEYRPGAEQYGPTAEQYRQVSEEYRPSSEQYRPKSEHYRQASEEYRPSSEQYRPTSEHYRQASEEYRPSSEQYRPTSEHHRPRSAKVDPEAAEAILVHPKLHLHRGGSRYNCESSASTSRNEAGVMTAVSDSHRVPSSSSQSSVSCSPVKTASNASVSDSSATSSGPGAGDKAGGASNAEEAKRTFIGMSETYTLEQSSFFQNNLQNITAKIVQQTTSQMRESHERAHKRSRSRSRDRQRRTSECTSGGSSEKMSELDNDDSKDHHNQLNSRSPVPERKDSSGRGSDGSGSESHREGRLHGHQRKKSKDFNIRFDESPSLLDPGVAKEGESSVSKPVLDGRKRHSSGSRPSSPMVPESFDAESSTTVEKKRVNVADALEQRLQNIKKSSSFSASDYASSHPIKHRQLPVPNVVLDDGNSDSVRSSHRHHSSGSEGDIPLAVSSSSKQDSRSLGSKLLQKLEAFTKSQEKTVREGKRKKQVSGDDERGGGSSRERRVSDSDGDQSSDVSGVPPRAPSRSDGSSGSHSDEGRSSRTRRTHRRTPSGGAIVPNIASDLEGRPTHSPIIMEGGAFKKSSTSVRRHASFHGLLPSKHQDSKLGTSPSDEVLKPEEHGGHSAVNQEAVTKSQRRLRSRTPSPSPATHQPVISASLLQKPKTSPT